MIQVELKVTLKLWDGVIYAPLAGHREKYFIFDDAALSEAEFCELIESNFTGKKGIERSRVKIAEVKVSK